MVSIEKLKEYFVYNDGKLIRTRPVANGKIKTGTRFGATLKRGYREGWFLGKLHKEHRLIWFYHYGEWPAYLDHINGDRTDNRIENLREVTTQQNTFNSKGHSDSYCGYKGVTYSKRNNNYFARIFVSGKSEFLGSFSCPVEAHKAYGNRAKQLHGEFYRDT